MQKPDKPNGIKKIKNNTLTQLATPQASLILFSIS